MVAVLLITLPAVAAVIVRWWAHPLDAAGLAAVTVVMGVLTVIDVRQHRLPDTVVVPLTVAVSAFVAGHALAEGEPAGLVVPVAAGLGASTLFFLGWLAGGVGLGDVKLVFPLVLLVRWIGGDALWAAVLVTASVGGVAAVTVMMAGRGRSHRMAYGPYLAAGAVAGMLTGP
ncbi:MAG: prepilin peptidase [Acidimicrobiales bacterium]